MERYPVFNESTSGRHFGRETAMPKNKNLPDGEIVLSIREIVPPPTEMVPPQSMTSQRGPHQTMP